MLTGNVLTGFIFQWFKVFLNSVSQSFHVVHSLQGHETRAGCYWIRSMPQSLHSCENLKQPHIWQHRPAQSSSNVTQAEVTLAVTKSHPGINLIPGAHGKCVHVQVCICHCNYRTRPFLTTVYKDSQYLGLRILPASSSLLSYIQTAVRVIILTVTQRKPWLLLSFILPARHHLSCPGIPASPRSSPH